MSNTPNSPQPHDSTAILRQLMAQFPEIPVTWAPCACESCGADYADCARDGGSDHPTCPLLCATCREAAGFVCADCAEGLPDAQHADVLCDVCERQACSDDNDERKYREAL